MALSSLSEPASGVEHPGGPRHSIEPHYAVAGGEPDEISLTVQAELAHKISAVSLRGPRADEEPLGYLKVTATFGRHL